MSLTVSARCERFALQRSFKISRGSKDHAEVVTVQLSEGTHFGRGEAVPYARYGESMASVLAQIEQLPDAFSHDELARLMPAGAARNAVDTAFWDFKAKSSGCSVAKCLSLPEPSPVLTAFTLSLDSPDAMYSQARANAMRSLLKTKLGGGREDIERIKAVRSAAPNARLIVDANEGWSAPLYAELAPVFSGLGVELVEQPLPAQNDEALRDLERVLPVCADESCHDRSTLAELGGKYDYVNIKLDKTGGLTEALALKAQARSSGFGIMVGCMVSSSLAMAPAILVAQGADYVDLDGPLLLAEDRDCPLKFDTSGMLYPADAALWG